MELNEPILVHWIDYDLLTRLGVAAVLGLLLGLDREVRGRAAGMRTHGLICFAAAAMTVSILALYHQLGGDKMDPLRVFEAAGAIIGIACGAGQWPLVLIAAAIAVVMLTVLGLVQRRFNPDDDYTQ